MQSIYTLGTDAGYGMPLQFRLAPPEIGASPADETEPTDREALFADFAPLVRRLMISYGGPSELREELVGEIYCRFCAIYDAFDPSRGVPLRPYIVRQLSASTYTFVRSYRRNSGRELSFEVGIDEIHADLRYDPTSSWDDQLMLESILQALPAAMAALPERQRKVVLWRYVHNWSFEEIAQHLTIQPATARSLLRHGLTGMRRWFAGQTPLLVGSLLP